MGRAADGPVPRAVRGPDVAKTADARGHRGCPGDAGDEGVERAEIARRREEEVNDATFQKWESLPFPQPVATITPDSTEGTKWAFNTSNHYCPVKVFLTPISAL